MPQITLDLDDDLMECLTELAQKCTEADKGNAGATTNGPLTVKSLLEMLAEDAAMVIGRPGCWEADGIENLLTSHGYEID